MEVRALASNQPVSPRKVRLVLDGPTGVGGTVVAKEETRTRRVDKGKSGQALKTAVSGGFGGGILSQILEASV